MITDSDGTRKWYLNDLLHRTLGPAMEYANGTRMWWLNGVEYTFTEWLEHNTVLDPKTRIILMLRYSERVTS